MDDIRAMLEPGLYEQLISQELREELAKIPANCQSTRDVPKDDAPRVLTQYLADEIESRLRKESYPEQQIALTNRIANILSSDSDEAIADIPPRQLLALAGEQDPYIAMGNKAADIIRPSTSPAQSILFTGAEQEPSLAHELRREIRTADRIDMLVSFIRWSGMRLLMDELRSFVERGGKLRVITTTYMSATDVKAVQELSKLPNTEVRISYDTKHTRLHAKAYIFGRNTGFSTAYVGSSNISNAALLSGLEWNVKIAEKEQSDIMRKMEATFDSYWNSPDFSLYHADQEAELRIALRAEKDAQDKTPALFFDLRPYPFQQEILDELAAEREVRGHFRNLVVAATGTGKTLISAFDYRSFRAHHANKPSRLLFIAHRREILSQSREVFRAVMRDPNFGDLMIGEEQPEKPEHVFATIQTISSQKLWERLPADYFDYIVVDEFHHAAAPTYREVLNYLTPQILLGLTATPERLDGQDILGCFDGHVAAELRLPEAIERGFLCPFQYFGVSDTVDLDDLRWTRHGYDPQQLANRYWANAQIASIRAQHIASSLDHYVTDMDEVKALGFCVSKEHAAFMAERFNECGIPSIALTSDTPKEERMGAIGRLKSGENKCIFTVDLFNEGIDIPDVNTLLFLRPTESLTVFLQQLGRGLRQSEGKDCVTVLDFIGQANKKYAIRQDSNQTLFYTTGLFDLLLPG